MCSGGSGGGHFIGIGIEVYSPPGILQPPLLTIPGYGAAGVQWRIWGGGGAAPPPFSLTITFYYWVTHPPHACLTCKSSIQHYKKEKKKKESTDSEVDVVAASDGLPSVYCTVTISRSSV